MSSSSALEVPPREELDAAQLLHVLEREDRLRDLEPHRGLGRRRAPSRFGRGPMNDTSDITSSSRIGSIGGFVTCAKSCLK